MLLEKYYENPEILHVGTKANRCYYVPMDQQERERKKVLSGKDWNFAYYNCIEDVEEEVYTEEFGYENFSQIHVPSCWQMLGFDQKQYVNVAYPFPFDPPYVPDNNPCGVYIKEFELTKEEMDQKQYLYFEGVDSCFYVWMNGIFVGYSQVSHSPSEFEITHKTQKGKNRISIIVLKWCDGSYLEDQDKFRFSGIFRDVYLLFRPTEHIRDYTITTEVEDKKQTAFVHVSFPELEGKPAIECELYDEKGHILLQSSSMGEAITLELTDPVLWNAENPYLYLLKLKTESETIHQKVGIRTIKIEGHKILLNDRPIKFKGVNRHDSSPYTGQVVTMLDAIFDLRMMKENNINAIRTSHYPNAPWFPELCNEYGFYLIAESDVEAHGAATVYEGSQETTFGLIAQRKDFEEAILDRVQRNVIRDKNQPCILIWSLGNESGYGKSFEEAGRWVKKYDATRLTHYESSIWETGGHKNKVEMLDLYSRMYASTEFIDQYFADSENKKPFIQCEFVHAMGNGPGDIEDYISRMYKYDGFCGGFVWEWCDHAIYGGKHKKGKDIFYYGGDSGEILHDGNFCVDGLVYPDRKPHVGLHEWKNAIRPVRAKIVDKRERRIVLYNTMDFTNLKEYLDIKYELMEDGRVTEEGILQNIDIEPHTEGEITVPLKKEPHGFSFIKLTYLLKEKKNYLHLGHELGFDQLFLEEGIRKEQTIEAEGDSLNLLETDLEYQIENAKIKYIFGKKTATFLSMATNGKQRIRKPMEFNCYRAPTDNDSKINEQWKLAGYDSSSVKVYETSASLIDGLAVITARFSMAAVFRQPFLQIKATWKINGKGEVLLSLHAERNADFPYLPRFGVVFYLPKKQDEVTYYGYGPFESYVDKHRASYKGIFHSTVKNLFEDYIRPQENGSHWNCNELKVGKLQVSSANPFCFNASYYTIQELIQKKHNYEIEEADEIITCVDYKQSGIGSNSCGPELLTKYRLEEESFKWEIAFHF